MATMVFHRIPVRNMLIVQENGCSKDFTQPRALIGARNVCAIFVISRWRFVKDKMWRNLTFASRQLNPCDIQAGLSALKIRGSAYQISVDFGMLINFRRNSLCFEKQMIVEIW